MAEELKVVEFIREQVPDWDDDVKATARFKAFSGQRSDWESQYFFWRDLIIKIAREFDLLFLSPSQVPLPHFCGFCSPFPHAFSFLPLFVCNLPLLYQFPFIMFFFNYFR